MAWVLRFSCLVLLASVCAVSQGSSLSFKQEEPVTEEVDETNYYLAVDGKTKPLNFVDKFGEVVGFDVDLVKAVCTKANKKCFTVLADIKECAFTNRDMDYAGSGLMSKWYDGCTNYEITKDKLINHAFTLPYLKTSASYAVAPSNPKGFNPDSKDFSAYKLVHVTGKSTNRQCLRRISKSYREVKYSDSLEEAAKMVLKGEADVLFSHAESVEGLEVLKTRPRCSKYGGVAMLLRKAGHIAHWWNKAFRQVYFSGEYTDLCNKAEEKYGVKPRCLPAPEESNNEFLDLLNDESLDDTEVEEGPQRLWKFSVSGTSPNYSYLDKLGRIQGFTKVLMEEVCKRAGKRCAMVTSEVSECIVREGVMQFPGRGLLEGWMDVCTGYYNNPERRNSWDFTDAYLTNYALFQVQKGNPKGFSSNMTDFSKFTIAYSAHSESNDHCMNRLHKKFGKVYVAKSRGKAAYAVIKGKADVLFATALATSDKLETIPGHFHCDKVGTAMMLRKGSEIPSWWNPAFQEYWSTGEFNNMCDKLTSYYGFNFPCIPRPFKKDSTEVESPLEGF